MKVIDNEHLENRNNRIRRCFRYSLLTMLALLIVTVMFAIYRAADIVSRRQFAFEEIERQGCAARVYWGEALLEPDTHWPPKWWFYLNGEPAFIVFDTQMADPEKFWACIDTWERVDVIELNGNTNVDEILCAKSAWHRPVRYLHLWGTCVSDETLLHLETHAKISFFGGTQNVGLTKVGIARLKASRSDIFVGINQ